MLCICICEKGEERNTKKTVECVRKRSLEKNMCEKGQERTTTSANTGKQSML